MTKWRITKITRREDTVKETTTYLVEKRFLGFLWWYDPFDDGMYTDGYFDTLAEAIERVIDILGYKETREIVWKNKIKTNI